MYLNTVFHAEHQDCNPQWLILTKVELKEIAQENIENIVANISVKDKEKLTEQQVDDIFDCEDNIDKHIQFKCVKCKNIVPLHDKFNDDLNEDQMCKLCAMFAAYDDQKKGLGPAKGLHCTCSVVRRQSTTD